MKAILKLITAALLLSGVAGSCAVAYVVGYSEGLDVQSHKVEQPPAVLELIPIEPQEKTLGVIA